jgi:hypothetical protein
MSKILKIACQLCWVLVSFFGVRNLPKATFFLNFLKRGYFVKDDFFSKKHSQKKRNHKLLLKESIATIITTIDYNFEEPMKMCPHNSLKLSKDSYHPSCIKKMKKQ